MLLIVNIRPQETDFVLFVNLCMFKTQVHEAILLQYYLLQGSERRILLDEKDDIKTGYASAFFIF